MSTTQLTLFLDEAYNDAIKIEDPEEPKWRTISRYIINNISAFSRISMVASLSTTKNLGATGDRLGAVAVTEARKDALNFASGHSDIECSNSNSLFLLVNVLEVAQQARKIKHEIDENLPIRTAHENPSILEIYNKYFKGEECIIEDVLHTKYEVKEREGYTTINS